VQQRTCAGGPQAAIHALTAATREACLEACSNYSSHALPAHGWPGCCEFIALRDADKRKCAFYAGRKTDTSPVKAMFAAECTLADDDRNDDTGTGENETLSDEKLSNIYYYYDGLGENETQSGTYYSAEDTYYYSTKGNESDAEGPGGADAAAGEEVAEYNGTEEPNAEEHDGVIQDVVYVVSQKPNLSGVLLGVGLCAAAIGLAVAGNRVWG